MGIRLWCFVFEGCFMSALAAFTILKLASQVRVLRKSKGKVGVWICAGSG